MNINTSLHDFKKRHQNKKNQIIFCKTKCKNNKIIENIINNFLIKKNSFIFESVEKRRIRGRYTIIGADPDKVWEFSNKKIQIIENLEVLGPVDSPIFRVKKMYRTRLLLRSKNEIFIQKKLIKILDKMKISSKIKLTVDVDPINFT